MRSNLISSYLSPRLDKAPYVTVSFTRPDGTPYGVPLSLARTDENTFYFHCVMEGEKLDCICGKDNPVDTMSHDASGIIGWLRAYNIGAS